MKHAVLCSLRVDPLFQKKNGSTKQRANAFYGSPINYSKPLSKSFVKWVQTKAA